MDYLELARPRPSQRAPLELREFVEAKLAFLASTFRNSRITIAVSLGNEPCPSKATRIDSGRRCSISSATASRRCPTAESCPSSCAARKLRCSATCGYRLRDEPTAAGRLFVPFATTKATGTGLGLPVVHQILSEHEATILCESKPEEGTAFTIHFPLGKPGATRRPVVQFAAQT